MFAQTRLSIGVGVGPAYPAPVYSYRSAQPGPDYVWVDGYWVRTGFRPQWVAGHWMRRPNHRDRYVPRFGEPRYDRDGFRSR